MNDLVSNLIMSASLPPNHLPIETRRHDDPYPLWWDYLAGTVVTLAVLSLTAVLLFLVLVPTR